MPLTDARKTLRSNHLTATDMTAILGVSKWGNAASVWLEKTGQLDESLMQQEETAAQHRGSRLESALLDEAESVLGPIRRNVFRVHEGGILSATCDAVVVETGNPVEVKTAGRVDPGEWGEPGTDQVPDRVIIQCMVQLICTGRDVNHVFALLPGLDIEPYRVERNEIMVAAIVARAEQFWTENVSEMVRPADSVPSLEVLRYVRRIPNKIIELPPQTVTEWLAAKEARSLAEKAEKLAKEKLLSALGDAEAGTCGALGAVTNFVVHKNSYTVKEQNNRVLFHKKKGA